VCIVPVGIFWKLIGSGVAVEYCGFDGLVDDFVRDRNVVSVKDMNLKMQFLELKPNHWTR
jgi:hypothetical protein